MSQFAAFTRDHLVALVLEQEEGKEYEENEKRETGKNKTNRKGESLEETC